MTTPSPKNIGSHSSAEEIHGRLLAGKKGRIYVSMFLSLATFFLLPACLTNTSQHLERDTEALNVLSGQLGTSDLLDCSEIFSPDWKFSSVHRNHRILFHDQKQVLIYDAVHRQTVKTVWQPLGPKLEFSGDGFNVGLPEADQTVDFKILQTKSGSSWSSFRYKELRRQYFKAGIEYVSHVPGSKIQRFSLPQRTSNSVQSIWMLEHPTRPETLNLIVKTFQFESQASAQQRLDLEKADAAVAEFNWYAIDANTGTVQSVANYIDNDSRLDSVSFTQSQSTGEPIAVAIEQMGQSVYSSNFKPAHQNIIAQRLFSARKAKSVLFKGQNSLLSSLDLEDQTIDNQRYFSVAWVSESTAGKGTFIQWMILPLQIQATSEQNQKAQNDEFSALFSEIDISKNTLQKKLQKYLKVSHQPTDLRFRSVKKNEKTTQVLLSWLAALDQDIAFLRTPVWPLADPSSKPQLLATVVDISNVKYFGLGTLDKSNLRQAIVFSEEEDYSQRGIPTELQNPDLSLCIFSLDQRQ